MSQENPSSLLTVVQTIERVCRAHVSLAAFDYGDLTRFDNQDYQYPLAYLETIQDLQENANGSEHTYTVALNLLDRRQPEQAAGSEYQGYVRTQDRLMQLFFEIKNLLQLDNFFTKERVGPADLLVFPEFGQVKTVRLRAEFTVEVEAPDNPAPDLVALFPSLFAQ